MTSSGSWIRTDLEQSGDILMNKLLAVLIGGAFAVVSASSFADDRTPSSLTPAGQAQLKAESAAQKAAKAQLTDEQRSAAKSASDAGKQKDLSQIPKGDATRTPLTAKEQSRLKAERSATKAANAKLTGAKKAAATKKLNATKRSELSQAEKGQKGQ